ncbi:MULTISPECIES: hypothetical protein [unclassified Pseudoalteromonas]|uniref:hypothetical protein n=1 Tax=unclassified Pseudoalteromonas TaxID=194690 RepID=UPI000FDE2DFF|nr:MULTISPECIES: hypothetical protein [unclassified Pseudoalteromonas]
MSTALSASEHYFAGITTIRALFILHLIKHTNYGKEKQEISSLPLGYQDGVYSPTDDVYYFIADHSSQVMRFKNFNEPPTSGHSYRPYLSIINN